MKAVVRLCHARLPINRFVICGCQAIAAAAAVFVLSSRVRLKDDHRDQATIKELGLRRGKREARKERKKALLVAFSGEKMPQ